MIQSKNIVPKISIAYLLLLGSFLLVSNAFSQTKKLPEDVYIQIDNFKNNAIKNRNLGNDNAAATYLNKIAYLYWEYFIYEEAVKYFHEVLTINQNSGNINGTQNVLQNIAFVYSDMEQYDKAIENFTKQLEIIKTKNDKLKLTECYSNLALTYNSNAQYQEAINVANTGLELSKNLNHLKLMRSFYGSLYESYEKLGDEKQAKANFELYSSIDKHIQQQLFAEQQLLNNQKLQQVEAQKKETEQALVKTQDTLKEVEQVSREKQLEINLLNSENALKEATLKQAEARMKAERRFIYFLLSVVLFIGTLVVLIFKQNQQKKRANAVLQDLNTEIERKNQQILDSIKYASHIQEAILPFEQNLQADFPDSFVLYKPRDIVSGDFYWHSRFENKIFVAAIDCTGHGVPGAFMSMIGNTLLNEIVNEQQVHNPAKVLKQLNEKVVLTLNQDNGHEGFSEDGMDITFCCYHTDTQVLELALANHNACMISENKTQIVEGDIFSIGGNVGVDNIKFNNHSFNINATTSLYMFSDGFQDQFRGSSGQKYMAPRFIRLLESLQDKPFNQHKTLLEKEYNDWKGSSRQIDDVLVIGIQLLKNT
ncbi:MAG: hypothetical protein CVU09_06355 [Bacteroidetes bacterium HGW-Bacteroidetes-4]|jgi:serine phosphatase RsbU (regulator of sigma subunit)|nr:MAG: hypothetical protein CVU09_06355 [Bacteroidetes bacterium HGW-Bacteroidetes-4]